MRTRMLGALSAVVLVVAAAGCGSSGGYANAQRPPAPVTISVAIVGGRIELSPAQVGAGPTVLLIANQSARSRELTLTAAGGGRSCVAADASSGPINSQGTARMQLPLVQGSCAVGVADGALKPARLVVGP